MNPFFAISTPAWLCKGCRNVCEWEDAVTVYDGDKPIGVRHVDCPEDLDA